MIQFQTREDIVFSGDLGYSMSKVRLYGRKRDMKKTYVFLFLAVLMLSGCRQGTSGSGEETIGYSGEQATETGAETGSEAEVSSEQVTGEATEEPKTQPEPNVTICTGIESRIVRKDKKFSHIESLDEYLNGKESALVKLYYLDEHSIQGRLYEGDEAREWTEEDWDLVRPLEQVTAGDMGYGKIDYNNDGRTEYFYRDVEGGSLEATGYKVSEDGHEITESYNLLENYQEEFAEGSDPLQLWFLDMDGTVVSFSLVKNTGNEFRIYGFLTEGDTVSVLEERVLETETKQVPESQADKEENLNAKAPWDFTGEDKTAYDLSWEELKSLRKEREVVKASQETGLPRELAELLQGILIRQLWEGWFTTDDFSTDDLLEPYRAKSCEVDEEGAKKFLGESVPEYLHSISGAYVADLEGDGKEELIMCTYYGGTIRLKNIEIWEQKDEGTGVSMRESYTYWYSYPGLLFVGGHYYYVAEFMNHYSGVFEGFLVFSFLEDGTVSLDKVTIESQGEGMMWKKLYENESLDSESLDRVRSYIESKKSEIESGEVLKGKAEIPYENSGYDFAVETFNLWGDASDCTVVDFDNDGEMECCSKKMVSSDHWATQLAVAILKKQGAYVRELEFSFPGYSFSDHIYCNYWQLWFEELEGKNYIFNVDRLSGSSDYFLTVQLIQDRKLYPVMNYLLLDRKVCKYEKADPEYYIDFH